MIQFMKLLHAANASSTGISSGNSASLKFQIKKKTKQLLDAGLSSKLNLRRRESDLSQVSIDGIALH